MTVCFLIVLTVILVGMGFSKRMLELSEWFEWGTSIRPQLLFDRGNLSYGPLLQMDIHNGTYYDLQAQMGCIDLGTCVQGDSYIFSTGLHVEVSTDLSEKRRIVSHADLAVRKMPLLMDEEFYSDEVVKTWGGYASTRHGSFFPGAAAGVGYLRQKRADGPWVGASLFASYDVGLSPAAGLLLVVQTD